MSSQVVDFTDPQVMAKYIADCTLFETSDNKIARPIADLRKTIPLQQAHPIVWALPDGALIRTTVHGRNMHTSQADIVKLYSPVDHHPLRDMPKDHPLYVTDIACRNQMARKHFAGLTADGRILTYSRGKTSWTSEYCNLIVWDTHLLCTADELKGTPWEGSTYIHKPKEER